MSGWLIDAHVHLHDCFPLAAFLDHARANLDAGARCLGLAPETPRCLMLTESAGADHFRRLRAGELPLPSDWRLRPTAEEESLLLLRGGEPRLVLVAGRQIATRERLEVLALGWNGRIQDGEPITAVLARVSAAGALAVVPWGFGKWWFGRGRRVARLVGSAVPGTLFLGDNGGRPRLAPPPRLFQRARDRGVWTLPGSDPLPFRSQVRRVGSYGFFLAAEPDLERPSRQIKDLLRGAESRPVAFGRREHPLRFLAVQARLHLRQRTGWGGGEY